VRIVLALVLGAVFAGSTGTHSVYVDGDSLAEGTAPYLPALLPRWSLHQSYRVGRTLEQGIVLLRAEAPHLERVVVLSLGTNDDARDVAAFRASAREILAIAGPGRCVVWANIVRPPTLGASYDGFNRVLAAEAATHRNLIVVDWQSLARKHPEWLRGDGVHATAAGYRARAAAIAEAVKECSARLR
jgi:lysophospholipase L1-like esterase